MAVTGPGSVLALRGLGLGDVCTGVPTLRGLRRAYPDRRLVLAGPPWAQDLLGDVVDEVVPTQGPRLPTEVVLRWRDAVAVAVNLHGRGPESTRSLRLVRAPRLLAFRGPDDPPWSGPEWRQHEHDAARWCRLLSASAIDADPGDLHLDPPMSGTVVPDGTVVVHPGASAPARRWPPDRFAALVRRLLSRGHPVVLTGSAGEVALCRAVADEATTDGRRAAPAVLAGATSVAELAAIVAGASLLVSNDTGVAHLATAYRTPSVVLFGPTPPAEWGPPPGGPHIALWAGSRGDPHGSQVHEGLLDIAVADVERQVDGLLRRPGATSPERHRVVG